MGRHSLPNDQLKPQALCAHPSGRSAAKSGSAAAEYRIKQAMLIRQVKLDANGALQRADTFASKRV
jgi:outer membrane protein TolC